MIRTLGLALLLLLVASPAAADDVKKPKPKKTYWDLRLFKTLRSLEPKLASARPCGLTAGGYALWEKGQLRLLESSATTLVGKFTGAKLPERATLFEVGQGRARQYYLLIAQRTKKAWKKLPLQRLAKYPVGSLVWDKDGKTLAVGMDKKRRRTQPAVLRGDPQGGTQMIPGYVIDEHLVLPFRWQRKTRSFEQLKPYWLKLK